jgi:hypothetical protein
MTGSVLRRYDQDSENVDRPRYFSMRCKSRFVGTATRIIFADRRLPRSRILCLSRGEEELRYRRSRLINSPDRISEGPPPGRSLYLCSEIRKNTERHCERLTNHVAGAWSCFCKFDTRHPLARRLVASSRDPADQVNRSSVLRDAFQVSLCRHGDAGNIAVVKQISEFDAAADLVGG